MCFAPQLRAIFPHLNFQKWSEVEVFCHFMCFAPQQRALFRHLNFQKSSEAAVFCAFSLPNVLRATTACIFSTSPFPKVVRTWRALYIFTSKCASRHNGVRFFDISTSKNGLKLRCFENALRATTAFIFPHRTKSVPDLRCFVHAHFHMCFAPQRRALFRHDVNFQKWS